MAHFLRCLVSDTMHLPFMSEVGVLLFSLVLRIAPFLRHVLALIQYSDDSAYLLSYERRFFSDV
jgi:hypothetical protein